MGAFADIILLILWNQQAKKKSLAADLKTEKPCRHSVGIVIMFNSSLIELYITKSGVMMDIN